VVEAGVCVDVEVLRAGVMLAEAETRPEEDQSGLPAVECPTVEEEGGRSSLRSEGVLLGLARVGKRSGSCSGGWRHVGAFHVDGVRRWGAEERRRRQSESARVGDGVGDLSNLCFSPKTRQGIRTVETGARGGAAWPARGGREGRWHGAQLQLARSERRPGARA
jgi:hypothetical protein